MRSNLKMGLTKRSILRSNFTLPLKRMRRPTSSARKFRLAFVSPEIFGAYVFARSAKFQQKAMFVKIGRLQIWTQKCKPRFARRDDAPPKKRKRKYFKMDLNVLLRLQLVTASRSDENLGTNRIYRVKILLISAKSARQKSQNQKNISGSILRWFLWLRRKISA